jgi:hypothetical protein
MQLCHHTIPINLMHNQYRTQSNYSNKRQGLGWDAPGIALKQH